MWDLYSKGFSRAQCSSALPAEASDADVGGWHVLCYTFGSAGRELGKVDAFVETDTCILPLAPKVLLLIETVPSVQFWISVPWKAQLGSAIHDRHRVLQVPLLMASLRATSLRVCFIL